MDENNTAEKKRILPPRNSIQTKLIGIIAAMLALILLVNLYIYSRINAIVERIDSVFASNVSIGELTASLEALDGYVYEYLSTKSSSALENYYRYAQGYKELAEQLNGRDADDAQLMLEKNIRGMSLTYLDKAEEAVQAKRGRNVERYRTAYEEGRQLYDYINSYIYELNTIRFSQNSTRYQFLLSSMNVLEMFSFAIIAALFVITLLAFIVIIRSMIGPLTTLARGARRVAEGDLSVEVPVVDEKNEIGIVSSTFNQMVGSIRAYIDRVRDSVQEQARLKERELSMEANLKEAQLKFLQAQINPHFLFNSLNAGAQLAAMEEADSTSIFLEKMADFFRYNVKKTDGDSTLSEEIELVDTYIYILNVRFAGDIRYIKEIEEGVGSEIVPGMILQPLVENAVTHGIREIMGRGEITLKVAREEDCIRVSIRDNGQGMTRAQIAAVLGEAPGGSLCMSGDNVGSSEGRADAVASVEGQSGQGGRVGTRDADPDARSGRPGSQGSASDSTGIGLGNVSNRLRLFYNREGLLRIDSEGHMQGTEVTVMLPVDIENDKIRRSKRHLEEPDVAYYTENEG